MVHLGFSNLLKLASIKRRGSSQEYPAANAEATQPSQNAAALLFDLGAVDIR
jgi:hypothetical protein